MSPSPPLNVLFIVRSLGFGGAERQLTELAKGLHRRGHRIAVVVYYGGGALARELTAAGVEVLALGKRNRWDLIGPFGVLTREVRRRQPEILHGYLPDGNLLALLARRASPSARVVWGVRASNLEAGHYDWLGATVFRASCTLARRADLAIANSEAGRHYHVGRGFPEDRIVVIPNGIDLGRFHPDPEAGARQRSAWGIPDGAPVIGIVGRLDPMKDHESFLSAAARFASRVPGAWFVSVGSGETSYVAHLHRLAASLGLERRLRWVPPQEDVTAVYNALDLLTSSSAFAEGFSNVVGEAMACGVRCVVTDVGDSALVVGDTGIVVPPRDPAALSQAWERGLELRGPDPRTRIEREFSVGRLVERTERALLGLRSAHGAVESRSA